MHAECPESTILEDVSHIQQSEAKSAKKPIYWQALSQGDNLSGQRHEMIIASNEELYCAQNASGAIQFLQCFSKHFLGFLASWEISLTHCWFWNESRPPPSPRMLHMGHFSSLPTVPKL